MNRRHKNQDTLQEYVLIMKEIANRADIDIQSVIQYIIDGIQDYPNENVVMYGAQNFSDFKKKLKINEAIKSSHGNRSNTAKNRKQEAKQPDNNKTFLKCYKCGLKSHQSGTCPLKLKD